MQRWHEMDDGDKVCSVLVDTNSSLEEIASMIREKNAPSLRDQFAMAALNGILLEQALKPKTKQETMFGAYRHAELANRVYKIADAMMKAREAKA